MQNCNEYVLHLFRLVGPLVRLQNWNDAVVWVKMTCISVSTGLALTAPLSHRAIIICVLWCSAALQHGATLGDEGVASPTFCDWQSIGRAHRLRSHASLLRIGLVRRFTPGYCWCLAICRVSLWRCRQFRITWTSMLRCNNC